MKYFPKNILPMLFTYSIGIC